LRLPHDAGVFRGSFLLWRDVLEALEKIPLLRAHDFEYEMAEVKTTIHKQLEQATLLPAGSPERQSRIAKLFWLRDYHNQHVQLMNESVLKKELRTSLKVLFA
jgi:hypothetical protein